MQGNVKPMGDRVLLERLDGDGREEQLASGIWIPARDMTLRQGNTKRIPDTFCARVLAVSEKAEKVGVSEGDEVLVHTYDQTSERTLAGDETPFGLLVSVENVIGVFGPSSCAPTQDLSCFASPKTKDFEPPSVGGELAVDRLGFFPRSKR